LARLVPEPVLELELLLGQVLEVELRLLRENL
jgi:hypothetical protein